MAVTPVASAQGYQSAAGHAGVFGVNASSSVSTTTFTYTASGVGNAVFFWVGMNPGATAPTTCSLSATGWVFSQIGGVVNGGAGGCNAMFSAYAPNTAAATITITWNQPTAAASNQFFNVLIDQFSGVDGTTATAGSNSSTGTGTPTVSITPTSNDCMIWTPCNDSITGVGLIGGTAATKGADDTQQDWSQYRLLTGQSGVAQSCTLTGSSSYVIGAVAIKPVGVTTVISRMTLLGVGA